MWQLNILKQDGQALVSFIKLDTVIYTRYYCRRHCSLKNYFQQQQPQHTTVTTTIIIIILFDNNNNNNNNKFFTK